jgi:bifunctional polynucleotide phosphatase/kinase
MDFNVKSPLKIAAFDLDGTLIRAQGGRVFARDANDWQWAFPSVPRTLASLHQSGHRIVIYTNQSGLLRNEKRMREFQRKVETIAHRLAIPLDLLAALAEDQFRKPRTGMHEYFIGKMGSQGCPSLASKQLLRSAVDHEHSFYVGDAAGRPHEWQPGRKKDHSVADRKFALNLDMQFQTPEAFFCKETEGPFQLGFDPHLIKALAAANEIDSDQLQLSVDGKQELIVMVGRPASGKSHFVQNRILPVVGDCYVHVNQDTLHTADKCIKVAKQAMAQGKSVIVGKLFNFHLIILVGNLTDKIIQIPAGRCESDFWL